MSPDFQPLDTERADYRSHLGYFTGQERLFSPLLPRIQDALEVTTFDASVARVRQAVDAARAGSASPDDFAALLSPAASEIMNEVIDAARAVRRERFGASVQLFTPLYLANWCGNACTYCGFAAQHRIRRSRLTPEQIEAELDAIAASGLDDLLLVTGESPKWSPVDYIADAVRAAKRRFLRVGVEVQPLNTDEYRVLRAAGADYACVYQETYNPDAYDRLHPGGRKRSYPYRFEAHERALAAGFDEVSLAALLGLDDWRSDALGCGLHSSGLADAHPGTRVLVSVPRLMPTGVDAEPGVGDVTEDVLLQVMCAYRLFLPEASITISSRETAEFRHLAADVAATRLDGGASTAIGEHSGEGTGDAQFELCDRRSAEQVRADLRALGYDAA